MSSPITVAIAGATGMLGSHITKAFFDSHFYPSQISKVIVFTRDANNTVALGFQALGAILETRPFSSETLRGIDVAVNALSAMLPADVHLTFAKACAEAGVKVYFPSDYAPDYYTYDFGTSMFDHKKNCAQLARDVAASHEGRMKVISLMNAAFMEFGWVPRGLDTPNRIYTAVGSADTKVSFTSWDDVGLAAARLSILAAETPAAVPDVVRLSGDVKSYREIAAIMTRQLNETVQVQEVETETFRSNLGPRDPMGIIRLCFGTGKVNQSGDNHNELVNPGQEFWKWKSMEDYIKETEGNV